MHNTSSFNMALLSIVEKWKKTCQNFCIDSIYKSAHFQRSNCIDDLWFEAKQLFRCQHHPLKISWKVILYLPQKCTVILGYFSFLSTTSVFDIVLAHILNKYKDRWPNDLSVLVTNKGNYFILSSGWVVLVKAAEQVCIMSFFHLLSNHLLQSIVTMNRKYVLIGGRGEEVRQVL